jgi:ATP-dependent Lon protease
LASLLTGKTTRNNVAMTGELTLNGQVLPVGGVKDKVLAAHRLGIDTVIIPKKNEIDLDDLPEDVRNKITFHIVSNAEEALRFALND